MRDTLTDAGTDDATGIDEVIAAGVTAKLASRAATPELPEPRIRRVLREAGRLTQRDLAELLGVDRASVARYESGARSPSGVVLVRYARLLEELRRAI